MKTILLLIVLLTFIGCKDDKLIQGKIVNKYSEPFVAGGYNHGTDFMFSIKNAYQGDSIVENKRVSSEDYGKYQIGDWYKIH